MKAYQVFSSCTKKTGGFQRSSNSLHSTTCHLIVNAKIQQMT